MQVIEIFLRDHWKIMLIGIIGVAIGFFLNWYFWNYSNKKLLRLLIAELNVLQTRNPFTLTQDEKDQIQYLKGEIYILNFKCK